MFFSIIIPVYNIGEYVEKCLSSVASQVFKDFEAIIIDDGSTDDSNIICSKFKEADSRFILIKQTNQGLSAARNKGLSIAQGKYVVFVDGDDFLKADFLNTIHDDITKCNADVIICQDIRVYSNGNKKRILNNYSNNVFLNKPKDSLKHIVTRKRMLVAAWSTIISAEVIKNNSFIFKVGVSSEDIEWSLKLLTIPKLKFYYDSNAIYFYNVRNNSLSKTISNKNYVDFLNFLKIYAKPNTSKYCKAFISNFYIQYLCLFFYNNINDKEIWNNLMEYKFLIREGANNRCKAFRTLCSFLGIKASAKLVSLLM